MTAHITDETIVEAIESNDDPEHPDALTVSEARVILGDIQQSFEDFWAEYMEVVEDGHMQLVHEGSDVLVFADHSLHNWGEELDAAGVDDRTDRSTIKQIHHTAASKLTDYSWVASDPFVIAKPADFEAGQQFVEAVVNNLQQRGLSPGQAWAYYGVEIRDNSRNMWGHRKGDHDHKNVSDALDKAKSKLP